VTRGEIIFEVSRSLGLDATPVSVDNPGDELILMQRWVNRGISDVLVKTRCFLDEANMVLDQDVSEYRIDSSILAVDEITVPDNDGRPITLMEVPNQTITEMLATGYVVAPAIPSHYYIKGTLMRVAPLPGDGITLRFSYVPRPAEIPADGTSAADDTDLADNTIGVPEEFHDVIVSYCLWQGAQYDDKGGGFYRGHAFAPGSAYQGLYNDRIKEIRKELRGKAGRGMHMARIGYPDRTGAGWRNDVYPSPLRRG